MQISTIVKIFIVLAILMGVFNLGVQVFTGFNARSTIMTVGALGLITTGLLIVLYKIKPLNDLQRLMEDVKSGKMNVNINRAEIGTGEIGTLISDVYTVVEVNRNLINDVNKLSHEYSNNGDIDYRIDQSRYENDFKLLVQQINGIIDNQSSDILPMIESVNKLAQGDFDIKVNDLPGKKAILTQSIRAISTKMNELHNSAMELAKNISNGNLEATIDPSKFQGSWAELAKALNYLATAVREPLEAIEASLQEMSEGDFEMSQIGKKYNGIFENARKAVHDTEEKTMAYIEEITDVLKHMAEGDLTMTIQRDYKGSYAPIKEAINSIMKSLNKVMEGIRAASNQVLMGTEQLSQNALQLANGTVRQTNAIEELTSSMDVISEKAGESATGASDANDRAAHSATSAKQGDEAVKTMLSSMDNLKASSDGISNVIKVISDIAFQTNLLALNASVEAARAGEHGKGFAVVADEVRSLAGRSQGATSDTTTIIEKDKLYVQDGINAATNVADAFTEIMEDVTQISEIIAQIADMSMEQVTSISTVNISIGEIAMVVQDNANTAQESAAATAELNTQAETLKDLVSFFKLKTTQ